MQRRKKHKNRIKEGVKKISLDDKKSNGCTTISKEIEKSWNNKNKTKGNYV